MTSIVASPSVNPRMAAIADIREIPPLENGDQLTLQEFMRRYEAMPESIEQSSSKESYLWARLFAHTHHGRPHGWLGNIVTTYGNADAIDFSDNSTVKLDPQQCATARLLHVLTVGARRTRQRSMTTVTSTGLRILLPKLLPPRRASTCTPNLKAYQKNGVREYVVWRVIDEAVDWFVLENSQFQPLKADENGVYRSRAFPGLWLNVPALLRRDAEQLWATLDSGNGYRRVP